MRKKNFVALCVVSLMLIGCKSETPPEDEPQPPAAETGHADAPAGHIELTEANFQQQVLGSEQPVLVDFYATWCEPCKEMAPIVAEVAEEYHGRAIVGQLDIDQAQAIAKQYDVAAIPTFIVFKNGKEVARQVGGGPKNRLTNMLDAAISN